MSMMPLVRRDADGWREDADGFRGEAAAADAGERGHARIVPSGDAVFLDQLEQLALAEQGVGEVEAVEFDLLRREDPELLDEPVDRAGWWSANSSVHMEWVTCSMESDWPCA